MTSEVFVQLDAAKIHTKKQSTIFKSHYTVVCWQLTSRGLEQEPVSVLGRNIVVAQGWGAGSSAGANWCCIILVNGTAFIYISEDLVLVCMFQSFVFPPCEQIQNHQLENVEGLCYCIWHNICYILYAFICTENELFFFYPSSTCSPKMTNSIVVCCDTALDSDSILGLFWMGFPIDTFSWKSLYFLYEWSKKHFGFWYLITDIDPFSIALIFKKLITFILDFKL